MEKTKITLTSQGYSIIISKNTLKELGWSLSDEIQIDLLTYTDTNDKTKKLKTGLVLKRNKEK